MADDPPAVDHLPGESSSGLFGGNSNRRGRVRMPTNDTRVQALEKFHRYLGNGFAVEVPCAGGERLPLTVPGLRS